MSSSDSSNYMLAAIFEGPGKIAVSRRPVPRVQKSTDAVIRISIAGLCGSDLHGYRGHEECGTGFIPGHEFVGVVEEVGSDVQGLQKGDRVLSPFTVSCGECWYCTRGLTSRCEHNILFGCEKLDGAQAEYVRVPFASTTLIKSPPSIPEEHLLLMGDVWTTGFYAAHSALSHLSPETLASTTIVVVGCGPVGLCAVSAASGFGVKRVYAIDSVDERLAQAKRHGAHPLPLASPTVATVHDATEGRGADVVLEIVGHESALKLAYELVRPFGSIVSVGVHNAAIPITGAQAYDKNVKLQFGRCPVRGIFPTALAALQKASASGAFDGFVSHRMPLSKAPEAYTMFDQRKARKIVFDMELSS